MSCFPGCAVVSDTLICGAALVSAAGGLAAALAYIAFEEGITVEQLCLRHNTLCSMTAQQSEGAGAQQQVAMEEQTQVEDKKKACVCTCLGSPQSRPAPGTQHGNRYVGLVPNAFECRAECVFRGFTSYECR